MKVFLATVVMVIICLLSSSPTDAQQQQSPSSQPKSCGMNEFEACLLLIKSVTDSEELAFASTMQDLSFACRKLQKGVKCADDHMRRCVSRNQRQVFEEVVKGTRDVITKLCIPGSTQMKYLQYSGCYKNVTGSETKCLPWFRKIQGMDVKIQESQHENIDEGLEQFCCTFKSAYECQVHHLRQDCGPEAVRFFEQNLNEMSNSLIHRHCTSFTSSRCDEMMKKRGPVSESSSSHPQRSGGRKSKPLRSCACRGPKSFDPMFFRLLLPMLLLLLTRRA